MRLENTHLRNLQLLALADSLDSRLPSVRILDLSLNCLSGVDETKLAVIINNILEVLSPQPAESLFYLCR